MADSQINIQMPTESIVDQLMNKLIPMVKDEVARLTGHSENYYTSAEVCQLLRISESTLIRRRKQGEVKFNRFGRSVRYPKSQFD